MFYTDYFLNFYKVFNRLIKNIYNLEGKLENYDGEMFLSPKGLSLTWEC